jgi:hypothetical protein
MPKLVCRSRQGRDVAMRRTAAAPIDFEEACFNESKRCSVHRPVAHRCAGRDRVLRRPAEPSATHERGQCVRDYLRRGVEIAIANRVTPDCRDRFDRVPATHGVPGPCLRVRRLASCPSRPEWPLLKMKEARSLRCPRSRTFAPMTFSNLRRRISSVFGTGTVDREIVTA